MGGWPICVTSTSPVLILFWPKLMSPTPPSQPTTLPLCRCGQRRVKLLRAQKKVMYSPMSPATTLQTSLTPSPGAGETMHLRQRPSPAPTPIGYLPGKRRPGVGTKRPMPGVGIQGNTKKNNGTRHNHAQVARSGVLGWPPTAPVTHHDIDLDEFLFDADVLPSLLPSPPLSPTQLHALMHDMVLGPAPRTTTTAAPAPPPRFRCGICGRDDNHSSDHCPFNCSSPPSLIPYSSTAMDADVVPTNTITNTAAAGPSFVDPTSTQPTHKSIDASILLPRLRTTDEMNLEVLFGDLPLTMEKDGNGDVSMAMSQRCPSAIMADIIHSQNAADDCVSDTVFLRRKFFFACEGDFLCGVTRKA